jgi:hypothetical protein
MDLFFEAVFALAANWNVPCRDARHELLAKMQKKGGENPPKGPFSNRFWT